VPVLQQLIQGWILEWCYHGSCKIVHHQFIMIAMRFLWHCGLILCFLYFLLSRPSQYIQNFFKFWGGGYVVLGFNSNQIYNRQQGPTSLHSDEFLPGRQHWTYFIMHTLHESYIHHSSNNNNCTHHTTPVWTDHMH
jgi:hypothetical protein